MLVIMDGHGTHMTGDTVDLCNREGIDLCILPPHTTHVLQPLDVGIFNSYKAAYRRSARDSSLEFVRDPNLPAAREKRTIMIARSLLAATDAPTRNRIISAFRKTGIYPISFDSFLYHCNSVRELPPEVRAEAVERVENTIVNTKRERAETPRVSAVGIVKV